MSDFDAVKKDRANNAIFGTNFGYEGRKLDHSINMFRLGFYSGFDDLKPTIDSQNNKIKELKNALLEADKALEFINDEAAPPMHQYSAIEYSMVMVSRQIREKLKPILEGIKKEGS